MLIRRFAVPLNQVPEGYHLTSRLVYPKQIRFLSIVLPLFVFLGFFGLAMAGVVASSAFRCVIALLRESVVLICAVIVWTVAPLVHGLIQLSEDQTSIKIQGVCKKDMDSPTCSRKSCTFLC